MTNKEKAMEIALSNDIYDTTEVYQSDVVDMLMQMAEWKDEKTAFALSFLKPKLSANEYAIVCDRLNFKE